MTKEVFQEELAKYFKFFGIEPPAQKYIDKMFEREYNVTLAFRIVLRMKAGSTFATACIQAKNGTV